MNTLQNIMAKSTVTALIALCLGFTLSAQAELSLVVHGVFSSPDTVIRQGDSATFSVTVSVEGDLPAGEHIADDYFELYWGINRQSDFYSVYSLGPTTATSISYTFDEGGESYIIMCSVSYHYKIEGEDDYTELWTEAEGYKDVVKVTGISLRASGLNKTIGQIWVKDDWDITTVPSGYRDMVDLPDHTITTHLHTVTATCGTSHADFLYRGITIDTHWDAWTPGADGTYDPDTFDYGVDLQGTDGVAECSATVDTSQGSGPITDGDCDVTFTGDGTHSFAVLIDTIGLCGAYGSGGGSGGDPTTTMVQPTTKRNPDPFGGTPRMLVPAFTGAEEFLFLLTGITVAENVYSVIRGIVDDTFHIHPSSNVEVIPGLPLQVSWAIPSSWVYPAYGDPAPPAITADVAASAAGTGIYRRYAVYPTKVVDPAVSGTLTWHSDAPSCLRDLAASSGTGDYYFMGDVEISSPFPPLSGHSGDVPRNQVRCTKMPGGQFAGLTTASVIGRIFSCHSNTPAPPWTVLDSALYTVRWHQ